MTYEYRNLMDRAYADRLIPNQPYPYITNSYDESSRRIRKRYDYYYQTECGGIEPFGGMMMMGIPIEEEDTCIEWTYSEGHYLYDRGQLLAIFDRYDDVEQFYVNGPGGQVAVYKDNDQSYLYYFIKDHLGSTRVMIDRNNAAVQFVNYHPFGEIIESWSSYDEPLKFTSKERDLNSSFDYYYFGSRYYDQRIGQFASVDKAGQFAGGYLYGGANPLIGVDPDGQFFGFLAPFLAGAFYGSLFSSAAYAVQQTAIGFATGNFYYKGIGTAALAGAIGGGLSTTFSQIGGKLANNMAYEMFSNTASNALSTAAMGNGVNINNMLGMTAGSMVSYKVMGNWNYNTALCRAQNTINEIMHTALSSTISSGVGVMVDNTISGRRVFDNLELSLIAGFSGGMSAGISKDIILGTPKPLTSNIRTRSEIERGKEILGVSSDPIYRGGGLFGLLHISMALGNNIIVNETNSPEMNHYLWTHETSHYWQCQGYGFGKAWGRLFDEQAKNSFPIGIIYPNYDPYYIGGNLEWQGQMAAQWLGWRGTF